MPKRFLRAHTWILPIVLILFILEIATLPLVISLTYSGRSESPDRVLSYTDQKLTWNSSAAIDEHGVAQLSLFDSFYQNVQSDDGANILAPGTEGDNIIRMENNVNRAVTYTAVVYQIKTSETLDIVTTMDGPRFVDTTDYLLPEGVASEQVIRAVTGELEAGQRQDFDIDWQWMFEEDEQKDINDTALGDKSATGESDDVLIGFYLVVEDGGEIIDPNPPDTGDTGLIEVYVSLMCFSAAVLIALVMVRRREKQENVNAGV